MKQKPALTPRQFIYSYIIPLFLAALVLVLISYYGEYRTSQARQAAAVPTARTLSVDMETA